MKKQAAGSGQQHIDAVLLHSLEARLFSRSEGTWTRQRQRTRTRTKPEREREREETPSGTAGLLFC